MQIKNIIRTHALFFLVLLILADARSDVISQKPIEALVGTTGNRTEYQNGWKITNSYVFFEKKSMEVVSIAKGNLHALILAQIHGHKNINRREATILAAIKLEKNPIGSSYQVWSMCTTPNILDNDQEIVAEITLKRCQRYSRAIHRAWLVDASKNTISAYPTQGIRCEDAGYNSGEGGPCPIIPTEK